MRADQIALQLYTVRDATKSDMLGTIRRLGRIGYTNLEFAGYGNSAPPEIRAVLDDLGMHAIAAHIPLDRFEQEPARVYDEMRVLGCSYAVLPYLPVERRRPVDAVRRLAAQMNEIAGRTRSEGFQFAYHNHDFEFAPLGGTNIYEIILRETDPQLVGLELDVYWAAFAGQDPVALIGHNPGRVPLLHVKDMAAGDAHAIAVPGEGVLPWPAIFAAARGAGTEFYIVEHDHPVDALRDAEQGLRFLEARAE